MGIDIRPCGRRKHWLSKSHANCAVPRHCNDWSRTYGTLPDFNRYPLKGLNLLRIRGRVYDVNLFKYEHLLFNKYIKVSEIPIYKIGSNKFPSDIKEEYEVDHRFRDTALDMKLRPRIHRWGSLNAVQNIDRNERRKQMSKWKHDEAPTGAVYNAKHLGIDVPDTTPSVSSTMHHFTEEYYLSYLAKPYDFSLTHNDLCSIDKDHIPVLVDMINRYFDKHNDSNLKLRHIELIDHTVHMNDLFLFSFSKVYIQAKIFYSTTPKDAFVTEFVAFSKYPKTKEMDKMISELSSMIYEELLKRDLDTNARLIPPNKTPNISTQFTKLIVCGNDEIREECITVKNDNLTNDYYPYLDIEMLAEEYLKSDDKLLILHGKNGSGKTKLSNILSLYLYNNNYKVIVCGGADINNPSVLSEIESRIYSTIDKSSNICIIIDDIEPQLLNRNVNINANNETINIFFNKLLLMLDGNFDAKLKVIITTNHILKDEEDEPLYKEVIYGQAEIRVYK